MCLSVCDFPTAHFCLTPGLEQVHRDACADRVGDMRRDVSTSREQVLTSLRDARKSKAAVQHQAYTITQFEDQVVACRTVMSRLLRLVEDCEVDAAKIMAMTATSGGTVGPTCTEMSSGPRPSSNPDAFAEDGASDDEFAFVGCGGQSTDVLHSPWRKRLVSRAWCIVLPRRRLSS